MKLYLDDNLNDHALAALLRKAGHSVVQPHEAGLTGAADSRHLEYAIRCSLVAMTKDSEDFKDLHQLVLTCGGQHPGIILVRSENDPKKTMKPKHILSALSKLEASGLALGKQILVLNHWR